ncbi:MAG TPA: hypothetical protein VLL30_23995, partial [Reyranella sp.]|nr:hypothetical protein [Reyranella sp.]
ARARRETSADHVDALTDEQRAAFGRAEVLLVWAPAVWYGLPLVIGSGLYILYRERVRARERGLAALT